MILARSKRPTPVWRGARYSRARAGLLLWLALLLAGCAGLPLSTLPGSTPATPTSAPQATPTGTLAPTSSPEPAAPPQLVLWLPPQFDPASGSAAARLLEDQIQAFRAEHDIPVQVRIKAAGGPGGLLDSLTTAFTAAPDAMPSLIALSRPDLETAALKGLIVPLDGASNVIDESDWYDYARQLAMVQGTTFSLPFAGDALVLAYRPSRVVGPPTDWEAINRLGQPLAFAASDPQAMFVLSLYQSIDGTVEDAQRRPTLDPALLTPVLAEIAGGKEGGIFPPWLAEFETSAQLWQAYDEGRVNAMVTWSSDYLIDLPPDTAVTALPAMDYTPLALANGWGLAVAENDPTHRAAAVLLAEYLTAGDFLARWSESAGYLPTRPSAMAGWQNASLRALLSPVAVSAQARPTTDQLASLGPVLREATLQILQTNSDPALVADDAAQRLAAPEAR